MQSSNDHNQRRRARRTFALLVGLLTTVITFVTPGPTVFAGDGDLFLTKSVEGSGTVESGEFVTFRLTYSCVANLSAPPITCDGATLVDTIPTFVDVDGTTQRLEYISSQGSIDTNGNGVYNATNGTVTFTFDQDFDAGSSGFVLVTFRPPFHVVPNGTVIHNTARLQLNGAFQDATADAVVQARTVLSTAKRGPASAGIGSDVLYSIDACAESGIGRLPADNVVVTDTIPAGATVVSTAPTAAVSGNTVTWNLGRVLPGPTNCRPVQITLRFPPGPFTGGQVVVNNETVTAEQPGSTVIPTPVSSSASTQLIAGDQLFSAKSANVTAATTGDPVTWRLIFESSGSDPLSGVVFTDAIPPEVRVTAINTGTNPSGAPVTVEYSVDGGITYAVVVGSPFPGSSNQRIDVTPLLAPGQFVTHVRLSWGATPAFWNVYPTIESIVINPDRNGTAYGARVVTNCVDTRYSSPTQPSGVRPTSCADVNVSSEPSPSIGLVLPATAARGTTVDGVVILENYAPATAGLVQPVVSLVVPSDFAFVTGSTTWDPVATGLPAPDLVEVVPNWDGSADSLVRWRWSTAVTFPRGLGAVIRFQLAVDAQAAAGTSTFRATISNQTGQPGFSACNSSRPNNYVTSDPFDRDGDGATTDQLCEALTDIAITSAAGLDSIKEVQGELDSTFTAVGNTTPGGRANYRLTVENSGTQTIAPGATFVDILPGVDDTLVASDLPRGSQWSPYLVDQIQGTTATLEYSTAADPCRGEVGGPTTNCTPPNWTTWNATLAANPTIIRSLRFTFPAALNPGDTHTFTWEMRVPLDLNLIGQRAYNSFAYRAQPAIGGPALVSEPPKVELLIAASPGGGQIGDYTWSDLDHDGTQDVNEPPIQGTLVELWSVGPDGVRGSADDSRVSFTRTDSQGLYLFQDVPPNARYYIRFEGVPDTVITTQDAGGDDELDSDAEPGTGPTAGWTDAFDFCDGTATCNDRTRDAGFVSALGSLTITKNVTGTAKPILATERFTVHYDCGNGTVGDIELVDGQQDVIDGIAPGSSCTLSEIPPAQIPGVTFGTAVFNPASPVLVVGGGTAAVDVILTNPANLTDGGFRVLKSVTGSAASLVPNTTEFPFTYNCSDNSTGNGEVTPNTPADVTGITAGATCTVTEGTPPTIPGVTFGTHTTTPTSITIPPGGNPADTTITINNPTTLTPGGFMVTKILNDPNSLVPGGTGFDIHYVCSNGTVGDTTISLGSPAVVSGLPAGTTCNITETLPQIGTIAWGTAVISPGSVTIPAGATAPVDITNTAGAANGSFTIAKVVSGLGRPLTTTADFTVRYTCDNGATDDIIIRDNEQELISGIPAGTICNFEELPPLTVPGVAFGTPDIVPTTLTIAPGASTTIRIDNPTTLTPGGFRVLKSVTGSAASLVPNTTEFPFTYNCSDNSTGNGEVTPNTPADITGITAGATCTVTEGTPPTIPGVTFGTHTTTPTSITIAPGGNPADTTITINNPTTLTPGGFRVLKSVTGAAASRVPNTTEFPFTYNCSDGSTGGDDVTPNTPVDITGITAGATCTVTEGTPPTIPGVTFGTHTTTPTSITIPPGGNPADTTITINNPTTLTPGRFRVEKAVIGSAAGSVPRTTEYTVDYNCGPGFVDQLIVTIDIPAVSPDIPAGATCSLSEIPPTNIPGVSFGSAVFSPPSPVVITAGTTITFELTNIAGPSAGDFTITKSVVGTGRSAIPLGTTYRIHYDCGNGNVGDFDLADQQTAPVDNIPAGSTCTVTEVTPSQIAGITYGTAVIAPSTFTVLGGGASSITVSVRNPATLNPGSFTIRKTVTGPAASLVPNGTVFHVDYDCGNGVTGTADVSVGAPAPSSVDNIPAGSTCTLTEQPRPSIPGVDFGNPSFTPASPITIAGGTARAVDVLLKNPTNLTDGSFTISKSVTGAAASLIPAGTTFTVDYACGNGVSGSVDVTLGFPPATVSNIPAGSICALTERAPAPIPGVVFGQASFSPASPVTVPGGAQLPVEVLLENPTALADGSFTITKILSGSAAGAVDPASRFTINWSCTGGIAGSVTLPVGITHVVEQIPAGTDCTIDETPPSIQPGVSWAMPIITPPTFRVDGGTAAAVAVSVENIANVSMGGFSVSKSLTGTGADLVPAGTEFEVGWSCNDGTSGTLRIVRDETALVDTVTAGSTCTLVEATPAAIAGVQWDSPTFSPAATFTVAGGTSQTTVIDLVNTATSLPGGFTITKRVTGGAAAAIDATWNFTVFYACSDGTNGSLTLQRDTSATVSGLTAGTTCRLSEAPIELRDGLQWSAPIFAPGEEFAIVADHSVEVVLSNPVER